MLFSKVHEKLHKSFAKQKFCQRINSCVFVSLCVCKTGKSGLSFLFQAGCKTHPEFLVNIWDSVCVEGGRKNADDHGKNKVVLNWVRNDSFPPPFSV